jgi:uncharacterized membrane protein HdeD (DUF308 family)
MHTEVQLLSWIIMIIGAMFAIPGIIGIVAGVIHSKKQQSTDGIAITTSIGSLLIGIVMMIWPTPFVAIFVYVLAAILIICGVIQIWVLASQYRPYRLPMWLYILPVLVVIAGVVMITSSVKEIQEVFTLMAGISMVATSLNSLFIYLAAYNFEKKTDNSAAEITSGDDSNIQ